ncbi:MAG: diguanylate cyclase [Desulfobulbaceae bacterium]|nr:diguanylate cyclase [Desulfobulbaceae bacterium]
MTTTNPNDLYLKPRILIVDDDPLVLELLGLSIKTFGFEFASANNGREAMAALQQQEFAIVITDMVMPEIDGMQLLAHINKNYPQTAVIVVTGYSGTFSYTDVIRAGASDFISKPFNSDELEAKINRILREHRLLRRLEYLSNCDPLTELYNRRHFDHKIREEVNRAQRQNYPLFLIMLDVDNFKSYNDTHGHQAGDLLLTALGSILLKNTRADVDLLFRHGGDEFAIITPQLTQEQAAKVGERILKSFADGNFDKTGISLGIAEFSPGNGNREEDIVKLISRADQALYKAKATGRNRIVFSPPEAPPPDR